MSGTGLECGGLREMAAELAVGALSGSERADALAHLSGCLVCRQLVGELTGVAEDLLLLAPELEPPPGFESRVLASLEEQRRPVRRRLRSLAAVAAAVVLLAAGGAVVADVANDDRGPQPVRTALAISASGRSTCRVVVHGGDPASLVVSLDGPAGSTREYVVEAQSSKGATVPVGRFALSDGRGQLAATVEIDAEDMKSVRVRGTDGELLYEAFPAPVPAS